MDVFVPLLFTFILCILAALAILWLQKLLHLPATMQPTAYLILSIGLFLFCYSVFSLYYPIVEKDSPAVWIFFALAIGFWFYVIRHQHKRQKESTPLE